MSDDTLQHTKLRLMFMVGVFIVGSCTCLIAETTPTPREFKPDEHTLLLAHFNDNARQADYAQGISQFAGNGARLAEGGSGRALNLHQRGLHERFMETCEDYTPEFEGWGFHARGNAEPWQGTLEFWFKLTNPDTGKPASSATLLNNDLQRAVKHPERKDMYASLSITLNKLAMRYTLPTAAGGCFIGDVAFKTIPGFAKELDPSVWHHFALTWAQGELVIWLDGHPLATHDMTGQHGLAIFGNPVRYTRMSDCVVDELRISNVVRYTKDFEPLWRDGKRPDGAFSGNPAAKRYDAKLLSAVTARLIERPKDVEPISIDLGDFKLRFDERTGVLLDFQVGRRGSSSSANGLALHRGLERQPLAPRATRDWRVHGGVVSFEQSFDGDVVAAHEIAERNGALVWRVKLSNAGGKEAWLEPLLGIPAPLDKIDEFFDGCEPRRVIHLPRHRDEYCS
ncbi:MAG: LamG domain-containing protein, partial [Verrucomicrobia bacterium]|nr:LamG domain-containing protein [Verrucomicrobiota bacterium]